MSRDAPARTCRSRAVKSRRIGRIARTTRTNAMSGAAMVAPTTMPEGRELWKVRHSIALFVIDLLLLALEGLVLAEAEVRLRQSPWQRARVGKALLRKSSATSATPAATWPSTGTTPGSRIE